jgi:hypothetical protein
MRSSLILYVFLIFLLSSHTVSRSSWTRSRLASTQADFFFHSAPIDLATTVAKVADVNPVTTTLAMVLERLVSP